VLAVPATIVVALVAAGVIGLSRDGNRATSAGSAVELQTFSAATAPSEAAAPPATRSVAPVAKDAATGSTIAPAPGQLQRFEAELGLRVDDVDALSGATKQAQQIAHDHGGTVASLQYDAPSAGVGTAQITLRIPTAQVEDALAELSQLGTIVGQRYGIQDLQQQADSLQTQIEQTQRRIAQILTQLESTTLSNENRVVLQSRLDAARLKLTGLRESLRSTRAEAATSTVNVTLTTEEIEAVPVGGSRLDGIKDVLAWEAAARAELGRPQRQLGPHRRASALLARDAEPPSERLDPVRQPPQAGSLVGVRAADAVVGDLDDEHPVVTSEVDPRQARRRVLGDVGERLRHDVERGGLDRLGEPRGRQAVHLHRQRRARGERLHGRGETVVGEDRRMDPAGELTELLESHRQLLARLRDQLRGRRGVVGQP
jgi:hypothetical protein